MGVTEAEERKSFLEMTPSLIRSEIGPGPVRSLESGLEEFQKRAGDRSQVSEG